MTSPDIQSIYNPRSAKNRSVPSFAPFMRLPVELREEIWSLSLCPHRLIDLHVQRYTPIEQDGSESDEEQHEGTRVKITYRAIAVGHQVEPSKLFRVNSEARNTAKRFYHIRIPCFVQRTKKSRLKQSVVYLNATYDFLLISTHGSIKDTLVPFFRDLQTHDMKGIGLLNLAFHHHSLHASGLLDLHPADLEEPERQVLVQTLSQLLEVWWVSTPHVGRKNAGPLSGLRGLGVRFNAGFPTFTGVSRFDRLERDPRDISDDLQKVIFANSHPREAISNWSLLLEKWAIHYVRPVRYRLLLAESPIRDEDEVLSYSDADSRLKKEATGWLKDLERLSRFRKGKAYPWEPSKEVAAVFGFWLFPINSDLTMPFGPPDELRHNDRHKKALDMRQYWPELAVAKLS